jgi:PAS domain S-box-containing protein
MVNIFPLQTGNSDSLKQADLNILLDSFDNAVFLVKNQRIIAVNARATELTAFTRQELIDKSLSQIILIEADTTPIKVHQKIDELPENVNLISRHGKKIFSLARTTSISKEWKLISIEPVDSAKKWLQQKDEDQKIFALGLEIIRAIQIQDPEQALSKTLESGSKLLDTSVLAIYVGNGQKPSARRVAFTGKSNCFPAEIFSLDLTHFIKPSLWIQGQRSIVTFLHQEARSAGLSYVATCPIGDVGALIGVLVAGGYQYPLPDNFLDYLILLGEFISNIIKKSSQISNLQNVIQENTRHISTLESTRNIISDGVILVNSSLNIDEINLAVENILGYSNSDVQGRDISDILIGTDRLIPAVQLALKGTTTPNLGDVNIHRRDGSEFPADIGAFPIQNKNDIIGAFIILRDQSEHEQNRIRTHQLEKRALLGEVTAVFAHEVRNPINNISTGIQLLAEDFDENDPNFEVIGRIRQDCTRLASLMESVLTFSRTGNYAIVPLEIGNLIKRLIKLWTPRLNRLNIEKYIHITEDNLQVNGDQRALEQVFTNLISNAIQAMEYSGGGTLGIKLVKITNSNGRPTVQIDISDTGPGISQENRQKIFDPFFTTKKDGTGLGLAITKQIITAHKGSINLTTFPGGTVFHIKLPAITS